MAFAYLLSYASFVDVDKDTTVIRMFATDNGAGLWGYVNRKNNSWIVPPCVHTMHLDSVILKKDETDYYFLGEVNSKKCVVNIDGDFIVPPVYDELVVLNYDKKLDYSSQNFENSYQSKDIYKRNPHDNLIKSPK